MRILLIHNFYQQPGGEDYVFRSEGELLEKNGHTVDYLTYDNKSIRSLMAWISAAIGTIYNRSSARRLTRKIISFKPDVIHVHNFLPLASPAVFSIAKKHNIPVVLTLHNYRLLCPGATLFHKYGIYEKSIRHLFPWEAIWKGVYRNSSLQTALVAMMTAFHHFKGTWKSNIDRYVVLTTFASRKFEGSVLQIPKYKFVLKPNFVYDMGKGSAKRDNFFLFAGRLTVEKGIHTLLKAAEQDGFNLIVVGDGPLRGVVEGAARLFPNICYLGHRPKGEVWYYLKKCKALIFPSIWYETFGMTIIEAFSTATPVIASRLGAMSELIQDGANGLLYEPGDIHGLCYAVRKLSGDVKLAGELSFNARITYLRKYTPRVNYRKLIAIYEDVIKDHVPVGAATREHPVTINS